MVNLQEARTFALSLPEATEEPHYEKASFRIRGKIFATVPVGGEHLHIFVDEHEARAVVSEGSPAFEELWWGKRLTGVRVKLAAADKDVVEALLEDAWRRKAPRSVVAQVGGAQPNKDSRWA